MPSNHFSPSLFTICLPPSPLTLHLHLHPLPLTPHHSPFVLTLQPWLLLHPSPFTLHPSSFTLPLHPSHFSFTWSPFTFYPSPFALCPLLLSLSKLYLDSFSGYWIVYPPLLSWWPFHWLRFSSPSSLFANWKHIPFSQYSQYKLSYWNLFWREREGGVKEGRTVCVCRWICMWLCMQVYVHVHVEAKGTLGLISQALSTFYLIWDSMSLVWLLLASYHWESAHLHSPSDRM